MKIICIGRNYPDHIRESEESVKVPTEPIFFCKPDTALLRNNDPFYVPDFSQDVQYETEVVVRINRLAKSIYERFSKRCYEEVGLGVDFTARDVQRRCIEQGLPWEISKGFDKSAAISTEFINLSELGDVNNLDFRMELNGEQKQVGNTSEMLFKIDKIISYISKFMTLKIGDLIFTGTPAGVGPVKSGDHLDGWLCGRKLLDFDIK